MVLLLLVDLGIRDHLLNVHVGRQIHQLKTSSLFITAAAGCIFITSLEILIKCGGASQSAGALGSWLD